MHAADLNKYQLLEWALQYDAYQRLAYGPDRLADVVKPLRDWIKQHDDAPLWAGVDLLRGLAFYLHRELNWSADTQLREDDIISELKIIAEAVDRHPDSVPRDRFNPHLSMNWKNTSSSWFATVQLNRVVDEDLIFHIDDLFVSDKESLIACYRIFEVPAGYQAWVWIGLAAAAFDDKLTHMHASTFCQFATRIGFCPTLGGAKNVANFDATERLHMGKSE